MTTETTLKLDDQDLSKIFDVMGHAHRAADAEGYDKVVPHMKEAAERLAQRAFEAGRNFERKHLG